MPVTPTSSSTPTYDQDQDQYEDGDGDEDSTNGATTSSSATSGRPTGSTGGAAAAGSIQCYRLASDFPPTSQWVSLQTLIDTSRPDMVGSSNDGPDEADAVIAAVPSVAESAGLDPRIAFAMMMQESSGKVRPIVGDNGKSYGLFQAQIPGIPLCNDYAKNECPDDVIRTQAEFGIFGHKGTGAPVAPSIAYWIGAEDGNVGRALRGYNTGSVPDPNDLTQSGGATASYVSDVANRLTGALKGAKHQATSMPVAGMDHGNDGRSLVGRASFKFIVHKM
ncbi:MAG: hypothetical protein Q9168_005270 [Polycauliona sp. 1 TL-2023]